ncbi:MAG: ankyrin repeat domain-containing protein [Acidobacteria bacterium]|nr:ankyrin repeat domain-containing protein [Acidobacteriota bacterium]
MLHKLLEALKEHDIALVKRILEKMPELALVARVVVEAGKLAYQKGLVVLHRNGCDLNATYRGYRPLHALIQERPHKEKQKDKRLATRLRQLCMRWMLDHGADPELSGAFPPARAILVAAFTGESGYVDVLLERGVHMDFFSNSALGDVDAVRKALQQDPSLATARDQGGLTALQCAGYSGMGRRNRETAARLLEIARLLADHGADIHARTKSWSRDLPVSYYVVNGGNKDIFAMLLERGMNPTEAIGSTVWKGLRDWTELAIKHGGSINEARDEGKPLLNQMIRWGQLDQASWLLSMGADPNITDDRGWTALHQAAARGNARIIKALFDAGADRERKTVDGELPYLLTHRKEIRRLLL